MGKYDIYFELMQDWKYLFGVQVRNTYLSPSSCNGKVAHLTNACHFPDPGSAQSKACLHVLSLHSGVIL